jgi:hypothetical protein
VSDVEAEAQTFPILVGLAAIKRMEEMIKRCGWYRLARIGDGEFKVTPDIPATDPPTASRTSSLRVSALYGIPQAVAR